MQLLGPFHRPGVDMPQPAAVSLICRPITLSSWIICQLVAAHNDLTDDGHLAQYGCVGAHEEAGLGRELVQCASLSLRHPVIWNSTDMSRTPHDKRGDPISLWSEMDKATIWVNLNRTLLAVREFHWQRIGIGLVPALEQTLRALCYKLHIANTYRVPQAFWYIKVSFSTGMFAEWNFDVNGQEDLKKCPPRGSCRRHTIACM